MRWSLTGTDAGDFIIDESGRLSFRNVPDHERPADSGRDNVYNLSVRASDGRNYGYLEVTVTVEDVNESPEVTGTDTFTYRENGTAALYTLPCDGSRAEQYRMVGNQARTVTTSPSARRASWRSALRPTTRVRPTRAGTTSTRSPWRPVTTPPTPPLWLSP